MLNGIGRAKAEAIVDDRKVVLSRNVTDALSDLDYVSLLCFYRDEFLLHDQKKAYNRSGFVILKIQVKLMVINRNPSLFNQFSQN